MTPEEREKEAAEVERLDAVMDEQFGPKLVELVRTRNEKVSKTLSYNLGFPRTGIQLAQCGDSFVLIALADLVENGLIEVTPAGREVPVESTDPEPDEDQGGADVLQLFGTDD